MVRKGSTVRVRQRALPIAFVCGGARVRAGSASVMPDASLRVSFSAGGLLGSAGVRENLAKGGGERVRIALLVEPAVVARKDHCLDSQSLGHGQRRAVREGAL
jgi:hypothetical protein